MSTLELQFADASGSAQSRTVSDDPVGFGVDESGSPQFAPINAANATLTATRNGNWLRVFGDDVAVHLNGRPVRHLAWIRAGDRIFVDGHSFFVVGHPKPAANDAAETDVPNYVLRGLAGDHFGQAIHVGATAQVGTHPQADVRLPDAQSGQEVARITAATDGLHFEVVQDGVLSQVNGLTVASGILRVGDQWVLGGRHRYVLESPGKSVVGAAAFDDESELLLDAAEDDKHRQERRKLMSRLAWLILSCALISAVVTLLLVYGPK